MPMEVPELKELPKINCEINNIFLLNGFFN